MTYSLVDLEVFTAAVQAGSLGRAAHQLQLAQPSVSTRVRNLERIVGAALFERSRSGVVLTAAGRRFLPHAEQILALAEESLAAATGPEPGPTVTIGVHGTFAPAVIPRIVAILEERAGRPGADGQATLRVRDGHSDEVLRWVGSHQVDVGVVVPMPAPAGVELEPLFDDPIICVVRPDHDLAGRRIRLADLASTVLAVDSWGPEADAFVRLLRGEGTRSPHVHRVATAATALALAVEHGHVGVLAAAMAGGALRSGQLTKLRVADLPRWHVPLHLAFRRAEREHEVVARLRGARALHRP